MEPVWPVLITFLGIYTAAIISPGPNFILVSNAALTGSRRDALMLSLGVATGSGLFALAGLAGLLTLVHSLPYFALGMRVVGGGYLVWVGLEMIRESRRRQAAADAVGESAVDKSSWALYRTGLLTNLTNLKAWAFYLSLFALVMTPALTVWGKASLNLAMFLISLVWYSTVAALASSHRFQPLIVNLRPVIQGFLGTALILLAAAILAGF